MTANVPNMAGKVMTVQGPMDPDVLGPTLMHEHLFIIFYRGVLPDHYTPSHRLVSVGAGADHGQAGPGAGPQADYGTTGCWWTRGRR